MAKKVNKKAKRSLIKYAVCLSFLAYAGYVFISQQITINEKKAELEAVNQQIVVAESEKKALEEKVKTVNTPEYIEEFARTELDYAAPDEIVFVDATAEN